MLKAVFPTLCVRETAVAIPFYERLGFDVDFVEPAGDQPEPALAGLVRDGLTLWISSHRGDGVPGQSVYFRVEDIDALSAEFASRGVPISLGPIDQTWGMREIYVKDPDGNSVRFGMKIA